MEDSMKHKNHFLVVVLLITALQLTACSKNPVATTQEVPPVQVVHLGGNEPTRVTLTADAAKRLDVQTDSVQAELVSGVERTVIPYSSIVYDTEGNTWIYTSPDALTYVRTSVDVDSIDGDDVVLLEGPPAGTAVVTVGAEELFGAETEFEEE
jgi:hypothetical protein